MSSEVLTEQETEAGRDGGLTGHTAGQQQDYKQAGWLEHAVRFGSGAVHRSRWKQSLRLWTPSEERRVKTPDRKSFDHKRNIRFLTSQRANRADVLVPVQDCSHPEFNLGS